MISQRARYAFKALFALVRAEGRIVQSREIAAAEQIPQSFLEQILLDLRRAGLVAAAAARSAATSSSRTLDHQLRPGAAPRRWADRPASLSVAARPTALR